MRTRSSVCLRKMRFASETEALAAGARIEGPTRAYLCDRCGRFHLTSRTKGKFAGGRRAPDAPGSD